MIDEIKTNKKIELLAPAKDKECAFAAINAGADAIYIGAGSFGARKKAGNSLEDIKEIVDYAHKFLVKIYVTVNTIIYDNELEEVEKLIWKLYEIGVDAIIFQDFAFFEMNLPPIALHASTQCNNDSLEKIKFLKSMNVERVVLPREFSIEEIKNVISNVDIETEVFIHGALCVSYSGQCYLSDHIGQRSANRGECAQPCRRKYSVIDENGRTVIKEGYLLSMKDNNQSEHLKKLFDIGVTSLKIEGRLKDKEYVTNVVSYYRKELDKLSCNVRPSLGVLSSDFNPDVNKTFNRTYTDFYIEGARKIFINPTTPKFLGESIGRVVCVKDRKIVVDSKIKLNVSDKIAYLDKNNGFNGTTVTQVLGNSFEVLKTGDITVGTALYRNFDAVFSRQFETCNFIRKVPISAIVDNEKIVLKSFGKNEVSYYFEADTELANNVEKAKETIVKQLSKLGESVYVMETISVSENFNLFLPVSQINEIRRKLIEELDILSLVNYKFSRRNTTINSVEYPVKDLNYSFNISNEKAKDFYEKCGCNVKEYALECKSCVGIDLMTTKHCLRDFAGICIKKTKDNKKLFLLDEFGNKYSLVFDCKKCVMKIVK